MRSTHSRLRSFFWLTVLGTLVSLPCPTVAADSRPLAAQLQPLLKAHQGEVAVAVKHLKTGYRFGHRDTVPMPTASLIKIAVMVEAYHQAEQGKVDLATPVVIHKEDKVPGSGVLTKHFSDGLQLPLRDAIRLMMAYSDNTATNLVLKTIGLPATAAEMERLGYPNTKIHSLVYRGDSTIFPERSKKFGLGSTTADETVRLLEAIRNQTIVSPEACDAMLKHLRACEDKLCFRRFLSEKTVLAEKTGAVTAARTAGGILETRTGPVAICVLTNANADRRWADDNAGSLLCSEIARLVFDHFDRDTPEEGAAPMLAAGASGSTVEALQRTLNQRLNPSPGLSVDGEFGPSTESAVTRFQKANSLTVNGTVDAPTWTALQPLVSTPDPLPAPEVVNAEKLRCEPADPLEGPPFVSCNAWALGDPKTGKLLGGDEQARPLPIASVTKLMTAYLVFRLAEKDASVLQEVVSVSKLSGRTRGSTADLRAGDRLPVSELLYGLLLPSGNDAAVAVAEHFGPRFEPAGKEDGQSTPRERFVAEMNRAAVELGMNNTRYENPHGLPSAKHLSTAEDQFRLAAALCRVPRFLQYCSTRQRGCRITNMAEDSRNVVWKNTNRLLEREGYSGMKTGTTQAAGACLVSLGERNDKQRIVVVLGSKSSTGRYVDTRNLFRWAWQQ